MPALQNFGDLNTIPLLDFLALPGHGEGDPLVEGIQACDGAEMIYHSFEPYPEELYEQCQAALAATAEYFEEEERKIVRASFGIKCCPERSGAVASSVAPSVHPHQGGLPSRLRTSGSSSGWRRT